MYGSKAMWVSVDGKHCYASNETPYIKLLQDDAVPEKYADGLDISMCVGTHTGLIIKSFAVTEYESDEPGIPAEIMNLPKLSQFELFVKGLPPEVHDEMLKTDEYLMNDMKSSLKFRRAIDKHGHLEYKASCGFIYTMREFGVHGHHSTDWAPSPNRADYTNAIFNKLAEASPEFADKMFDRLQICNPHTRDCTSRIKIEFNGETRSTCRGKIFFKMFPSEFEDVRKVAAAASEIKKAAL